MNTPATDDDIKRWKELLPTGADWDEWIVAALIARVEADAKIMRRVRELVDRSPFTIVSRDVFVAELRRALEGEK